MERNAQRLLLAGLRRSLPTQIEPDAVCCGRFEHHLLPPTWWIDWSVGGPSARNWRRPLLFSVALLGAGIALVLNLR
jgi:hypothetical protein